jgi:DNA repair photolyase
MIGDALGDLMAANKNGVRFYPIIAGEEDTSWKKFHDEAIDTFVEGKYAGDYEKGVISEFEKFLPDHPAWLRTRNE